MKRLLPPSLAGRFALAAAGMAAAAVLLVALLSWWLIERQQDKADLRMAVRERQFHAANVGSTLRALGTRMSEISGSTILATGLVDSAGKETYLAPFLNGIRQIDGIPVQVMFTDFEGKEVASSSGSRFDDAQAQWLRRHMAEGVTTAMAAVFSGAAGHELVAMEPLRYSRTTTPEGAVLYKIVLADIRLDPGLQLRWGPPAAGEPASEQVRIDTLPVFESLQFRVEGRSGLAAPPDKALAPFLAMGLVAAFVAVALFLAGRRLAQVLTRDLLRLQVFASNVVSADSGEQRAPETGSAEVVSLSRSVNRMLERLYQQHGALRAEGDKLARLAAALRDTDRRKDEFLAMLAHELRNPLAPISTGAELLRHIPDADPRVRRTSDIISRQARHMTKIVDDLLDVSRVTRGLVSLERAPVDLSTVIAAAVDQIRPAIDARGHRLELAVAPHLPVTGDPARLVQVVSNLLHNACKYTPPGGNLQLDAHVRGEEVVVQVGDNGSGIAPDFLPEIFGLFTQGSRLPDRSQGGLGLGLPLVKHLVELHGGTVEARSDGPGEGSTFTVRLPLGPAAPAPAAEGAPVRGVQGLRLLVVDDNADAALTLSTLLQWEGHEVQVAQDGPSALALARSHAFDAFILDIGLPGMDGIELAGHLRRMPDAREALIVALSGYGQPSDRDRTRAGGFDHHLVKPVDLGALTDVLARARRAVVT